MRFAYYRRLNASQKLIYDRSDQAPVVRVPGCGELAPVVAAVARGLAGDDRAATEAAAQQLVDSVLRRLHVPPVTVRVLAVRPSNHREELHGLYEFGGSRKQALVSVWMRTAQKRQVVAFRSFVRTLLHEVVHHLDYQLLHLADSYHTAGFYKRAEALYRQLVPAGLGEKPEPARRRETRAEKSTIAAGSGSRAPVAPGREAPAPRPASGVDRVGVGERPAKPAAGPPRRSPRRPAPREDTQPLLPFMD